MAVGVVLAVALGLAMAWSLTDVRRHPERWSSGQRWMRTATWGAAFTVAVVAGAALGGAGWEEIVAILLIGWLFVRLFATVLANEASQTGCAAAGVASRDPRRGVRRSRAAQPRASRRAVPVAHSQLFWTVDREPGRWVVNPQARHVDVAAAHRGRPVLVPRRVAAPRS